MGGIPLFWKNVGILRAWNEEKKIARGEVFGAACEVIFKLLKSMKKN